MSHGIPTRITNLLDEMRRNSWSLQCLKFRIVKKVKDRLLGVTITLEEVRLIQHVSDVAKHVSGHFGKRFPLGLCIIRP